MVPFEKVKKKFVMRAGILLAFILVIVSLAINNFHVNEYKFSIQKYRNEKDDFFLSDEQSPVKNKEAFEGLLYYDVFLKYKLKAKLEFVNSDSATVFKLPRNDGQFSEYVRFAKAHFTIDTKPYQLLLLKSINSEDSTLFLPFNDKTNGEFTYQGGRYLDIAYSPRSKYIDIDFNLAYNPYCVYNYKYSCPLPPSENHLPIKIEAGEKLYKLE